MKIHKRQGGSAHFLLFALVTLVVVGAAGYWVWVNQDKDRDDAVTTPAPAKDCEGDWYDTHVHADETDFSRDVADQMRSNKVGCSLAFTQVDINDPETSMLKLREEFAPNPGRFALFADIIDENPSDVTRQKLEKLFSAAPDTFKGFGEFAFYRQPHQGTDLKAEPWPTIFEFAAEKNLFVMLHLTPKEAEDAEAMFTKYPNAKVLIHHREMKDRLPEWLKQYKNLYYTLDVTNLTTLENYSSSGPPQDVLLYPGVDGNAKDFLSKLQTNREGLLNDAIQDWLPVFEAAPEKIFWGTDVSMDWHTEPEVYKALVDFSNDFAAKLPQEYREGYKFQNAFKVMGKGITLQDLSESETKKLDEADTDEN